MALKPTIRLLASFGDVGWEPMYTAHSGPCGCGPMFPSREYRCQAEDESPTDEANA
jgi:hypothetical protein